MKPSPRRRWQSFVHLKWTKVRSMSTAARSRWGIGVDAVVQFKFTGAEAGEWNATIKDGKVEVARGMPPRQPTMTLTADSGDYVKIFTGDLDSMQAFMQGKIKLAGDLNVAMKLMQ